MISLQEPCRFEKKPGQRTFSMVCFSIEAAQLANFFVCVSSEFCILTSVANMRPPTCSFIFSISSDVQPFKMGVTVTEGHKQSQNEIGSTFFLLCRQKEGKKIFTCCFCHNSSSSQKSYNIYSSLQQQKIENVDIEILLFFIVHLLEK